MESDAPHSAESARSIQRSLNLSHWLFANNPKGYTFSTLPTSPEDRKLALQHRLRHKVAVSQFEISLDHHTSIVFLCMNHMRTSAFSLVRSQFDAAWQGAWAAYAAPFDLLQRYCAGTFRPHEERTIKAVDKALGSAPFFSKYFDGAWKTLCNYNHSGHLQLGRWIGEDEIGPKHTDEEMTEILQLSDQIALCAGVFLADLCNADPGPIQKKFGELFGAVPGRNRS